MKYDVRKHTAKGERELETSLDQTQTSSFFLRSTLSSALLSPLTPQINQYLNFPLSIAPK